METTALQPIPTQVIVHPASTHPDQHPVLVYLARLGPGSRRTVRAALETIATLVSGGRARAETLPWAVLRYQHTAAIRAALTDRYAPATVNKHLAALRGVLREAWHLGFVTAEDYHRAVAIAGVKRTTLLRGRALTPGEFRALFAACVDHPTPAGARDAALVAVLYGAGLRRSEVVALELTDYDPETGALVIRQGKGNKDRVVYVTNESQEALAAWLEVRGREPGQVFSPVTKGGRVVLRRMTDQAVLSILRRLATKAGVAHFTPHDMRRTFISDLLDAGADIRTVQQLAGHESIETTARYDRRGERAKRRAAEMLHVPYPGRRRDQ